MFGAPFPWDRAFQAPEADEAAPDQEDGVSTWRLGCLVLAYKDKVESIEDKDLKALIKLSESRADLRQIERALEAGCTPRKAVKIFL